MKFIFIILLICFSSLYSQTPVEYRYYKNIKRTNQVAENKGKYVEIIEHINDSIKKIKFIKIDSHSLIWEREYKNNVPFGTWCTYDNNGQQTSKLIYGREKPDNFYSVDVINKRLKGYVMGDFIMPELAMKHQNEVAKRGFKDRNDIRPWIATQVKYPVEAQENGIQGEVLVQFTVDEKGQVGNVKIVKGVHEILDKEVYRLIHTLSFSEPGKLNGENIGLYFEAPVNFRLSTQPSFIPIEDKPIDERFRGEEIGLRRFLAKKIRYPSSSQVKNSIGFSVSSITISQKGQIEKIGIINSIDEEIDEEVIRVLKSTKKYWKSYDSDDSQTFYIQIAFIIGNGSLAAEIDSPLKNNPFFIEPIYVTANGIVADVGPKIDEYFVEQLTQSLKNSDYDRGLQCLSELIKRNPFNPKFYQLRIFICGKLNNSELMRKDIERVNNFIPGVSLEQLLNKN